MRYKVCLYRLEDGEYRVLREYNHKGTAFQSGATIHYAYVIEDGIVPAVIDSETNEVWVWENNFRRRKL